MAIIYLPQGSRLKSYSSATKGTLGTLKIEIELRDLGDLGYLLHELGALEEAQKREAAEARKAAAEAARAAAKAAKKPPQLALPAPPLALPRPDGGGY